MLKRALFGIEEDALWMWWCSGHASCFCWSVSYLLPVVRRHVLQTLTIADILSLMDNGPVNLMSELGRMCGMEYVLRRLRCQCFYHAG